MTEHPPKFGPKSYRQMPMSGARTVQAVRFSLLYHGGLTTWACDAPVVEIVGGGETPRLALARESLQHQGYASPEEAATALTRQLPKTPRHAIPDTQAYKPDVYTTPEDPLVRLLAALVLGRCVDGVFDPARPHIWTERRLSRKYLLFEPRGFYDR